jgi:antitoxin HigA-1
MRTVNPGRILRRELKARGLSANALALALGTPSGRITDILNEKRAVSAETALRLGRYFGQNPRFWINLRGNYELAKAEAEVGKRLDVEVVPAGCSQVRSP